jgi:hypothetical protein
MPDDAILDTPGGRRCASCLYGWGVTGSSSILVRLECRRFPPQAGDAGHSYWFPVSPNEWCGEWREYSDDEG